MKDKRKQKETVIVRKGSLGPDPKPMVEPTSVQSNVNPWTELNGKAVTIQSRSGVIYSGTLAGYAKGLIKFAECKLIGTNRTITVPWLHLDRGAVLHVHPYSETAGHDTMQAALREKQ